MVKDDNFHNIDVKNIPSGIYNNGDAKLSSLVFRNDEEVLVYRFLFKRDKPRKNFNLKKSTYHHGDKGNILMNNK